MQWNDDNMLVPTRIIRGTKDNIKIYPEYEWISKFPNNIYYALFLGWNEADLLPGYDYYVVSFHREAVDLEWIRRQSTLLDSPIFVLFDGNNYDYALENVTFISYYYWHQQLNKMLRLFGTNFEKNIKYKASAFTNRVTQSKIYVFTALQKYMQEHEKLVTLSKWIEPRNIHYGELTGNKILDDLYKEFEANWVGKEIKIDDFNNDTDNCQVITGNPDQPAYQECAIHFTNESFHYSFMMSGPVSYIYPGPFITEKTLKCLLGATGFIPNGQFELYKTLTDLGLNFDYDFDTSFDNDPGNLTRLESIVNLIKQFADMDTMDIFNATKEASEYNQQQIINRQFAKNCKSINDKSVELLHKLLR